MDPTEQEDIRLFALTYIFNILNDVTTKRDSEKLFGCIDMIPCLKHLVELNRMPRLQDTFTFEKTSTALRKVFYKNVFVTANRLGDTNILEETINQAPYWIVRVRLDGNLILETSGRGIILGSKYSKRDQNRGIIYGLQGRRHLHKILTEYCFIRNGKEIWAVDRAIGDIIIIYKNK